MAVAGSYTAETLITSIRRRGQFPAADDGTSFPRDSDILAIVNEEVAGYLAPFINQMRQGHFITHVDLTLSTGVASYPIPARAMNADLSSVQLVDANGYPLAPPLVQGDLETATRFPTYSLGQPLTYYWEGDQMVFVPTPSTGMTARLYYPQRVNQLVPATGVVAISGFPGGAAPGFYRVGFNSGTAPSSFVTGATYEGISQNPSFQKYALGVPNAVNVAYIEFAGTQPANLAVGDSLVLQDTANVLTGIPADLFGLIAQWIVVKLAEIRGDTQALQRADGAFQREEKRASASLGKRTQLARRKISSSRGPRVPFFVK
ncbi:MAG: hypothetical protein NVS3B25_09910 [Hymenobacter sp.]